MIGIRKKLETLQRYFEGVRRVGHTRAMLDGAREQSGNVIVVASSENERRLLKRHLPTAKIVSLGSLDMDISGLHAPLVLDNEAVRRLCQEAGAEIDGLKAEIRRLEQEASQFRGAAGPSET